MRYANIYIYIFVLHRDFFQQPRGRVAPRLACVRGALLFDKLQFTHTNQHRSKKVCDILRVFLDATQLINH